MKLIQIVDSLKYVQTNCWQRQLFSHLNKEATHHDVITLADLRVRDKLPGADVILSTLKLRSLSKERELLKAKLGNRRVFIYEQDPWENFIDQGSCHGTYEWCRENLNVGSFILTSKWWTDYVASRGFKTQFAQMWMDSTLCDYGVSWESRPVTVGFMGGLHPYRKSAINELAKMAIDVQIFPSGTYEDFLACLSQMQFFFHWEAGDAWTIDGIPVGQNALWAKEIEIASRGCYALRQYEDEADAYLAREIPCIIPFIDIADIPGIVKNTLADPLASINSQISVDRVRSHRGWFNLSDL